MAAFDLSSSCWPSRGGEVLFKLVVFGDLNVQCGRAEHCCYPSSFFVRLEFGSLAQNPKSPISKIPRSQKILETGFQNNPPKYPGPEFRVRQSGAQGRSRAVSAAE